MGYPHQRPRAGRSLPVAAKTNRDALSPTLENRHAVTANSIVADAPAQAEHERRAGALITSRTSSSRTVPDGGFPSSPLLPSRGEWSDDRADHIGRSWPRGRSSWRLQTVVARRQARRKTAERATAQLASESGWQRRACMRARRWTGPWFRHSADAATPRARRVRSKLNCRDPLIPKSSA